MNYVQEVVYKLNHLGLDKELVYLYTLLALVKGADVSQKDVHDAWAVWRNRTKPEHKSLVPFENLSKEVQELDEPYRQAIIEAWKTTI